MIASRFSRTDRDLCSSEALTKDAIRRIVPSTFAVSAHENRSSCTLFHALLIASCWWPLARPVQFWANWLPLAARKEHA